MTFAPHDAQFLHLFEWGTYTTLMYFGCLLLLLHADGPFQRWLSAPIFRPIATLGYGVYLVHMPLCDRVVQPVAQALLAKNVPMWVLWPSSLATCCTCWWRSPRCASASVCRVDLQRSDGRP
jgi:peptidoglycan/LPS O-acetylase OafA/YrhL